MTQEIEMLVGIILIFALIDNLRCGEPTKSWIKFNHFRDDGFAEDN